MLRICCLASHKNNLISSNFVGQEVLNNSFGGVGVVSLTPSYISYAPLLGCKSVSGNSNPSQGASITGELLGLLGLTGGARGNAKLTTPNAPNASNASNDPKIIFNLGIGCLLLLTPSS